MSWSVNQKHLKMGVSISHYPYQSYYLSYASSKSTLPQNIVIQYIMVGGRSSLFLLLPLQGCTMLSPVAGPSLPWPNQNSFQGKALQWLLKKYLNAWGIYQVKQHMIKSQTWFFHLILTVNIVNLETYWLKLNVGWKWSQSAFALQWRTMFNSLYHIHIVNCQLLEAKTW